MSKRVILLLITLFLAVSMGLSFGQAGPPGRRSAGDGPPYLDVREFRINTGGWVDNQSPSLDRLLDGRLLVIWHQFTPTSCYARVYSPDGEPATGELRVDSAGFGWRFGPTAAPLSDGGFVGFWGADDGTFGQAFNTAFRPVGPPFQVFQRGGHWAAAIALSNGDVIVVAAAEYAPYPILARRYDPTLFPYGPATPVNQNPPGAIAWLPVIASAPNGDYTIVWRTAAGNIAARMFDASGQPRGDEFIVNSSTSGARYNPNVAYNSRSELVIAWEGPGEGDPQGIYARRFQSNGIPIEDEWRVNQVIIGTQARPIVGVGPDDQFAVAWYGGDVSGWGVFARLFDRDAQPLSNEFQVNQYTAGDQVTPSNGGRKGILFINNQLIVSWHGNGAQGLGSYLTMFTLRPPEPVPSIIVRLTGCTQCQVGDTFSAILTINNPLPVAVERKRGYVRPDGTTGSEGDRHVELPAGFNGEETVQRLITAADPPGSWAFCGRLLEPNLGDHYAQSCETFTVVGPVGN